MSLSYHWRLKKHLSLVHNDFVGAELRSPKEGDVLVLEGFQRLWLASLVHRHIVGTHTQPQVVGEASLFALRKTKHSIKKRSRPLKAHAYIKEGKKS